MDKPLGYMGLARRAGRLQLGETDSGAAVRAGKGVLLVLASDASDNARRRAEGFVYGRSAVFITAPYTKDVLASALGKYASMAAFTDTGLAYRFALSLSELYPGEYDQAAADLGAREDKAVRRKAEKRGGKTATGRKSL